MASFLNLKSITAAVACLILLGSVLGMEPSEDPGARLLRVERELRELDERVNSAQARNDEVALQEYLERRDELMSTVSKLEFDMTYGREIDSVLEEAAIYRSELSKETTAKINTFKKMIDEGRQRDDEAMRKKRQANPELDWLYTNLMSAVERNDREQVLPCLNALNPFVAAEKEVVTHAVSTSAKKALADRHVELLGDILVRTDPEMAKSIYLSSIGGRILSDAARSNDLEGVRYLLTVPFAFMPLDLESLLVNACTDCNLGVLQLGMDFFKSKGLTLTTYDYSGLYNAVWSEDEDLVKRIRHFLVLNFDKQLGIKADDMRFYFKHVALLAQETGEMELLEALLNRPADHSRGPSPSSDDIDGFICCYVLNVQMTLKIPVNIQLMNLFFNRTADQPRPSDDIVGCLINIAAKEGCVDFIRSMVERDAKYVRPTDEDLNSARKGAQETSQKDVVNYLSSLILAKSGRLF
jgi:hypothetical protein